MDTNNENNEQAKSKIEKIRIDLEKKLAALEAAKINSEKLKVSGNETLNENDGIVNETTPIVPVENTKKTISNIDSENQKFIEQISKINESSKFVNKDNNSIADENESTFFEINDEIKNVNENNINISKEKTVVDNTIPVIPNLPKEKVKNTTTTVTPRKTPIIVKDVETKTIKKESVVSPKVKEVRKDSVIENNNIEENKQKEKSNLNTVIYALGGVILIALIYLSWSFLGNSSSDDIEKNRILSEYENRRYKDSIELADANNLLLDYESQRYVDSIALANQINLESRNAFANNSLRDRGNDTALPNINTIPVNNVVVDNANSNDVNENTNDKSGIDNTINDEVVNNEENTENNNTDATNDIVSTDNAKEQSEGNSNSDNTNAIEEIKKPIKKTETLTTIEKSPVYPGCEKSISEKSKKRCFISKISKFVSNRFNSDLSQDLGLEAGVKRINVSFVIDKSGNVNVLKVRAQHKVLEKEALRVVNALPKMKAGKKKGKSEPVYYNLPIVYKVE